MFCRNTKQMCVSSLREGYAHLLCIVPVFNTCAYSPASKCPRATGYLKVLVDHLLRCDLACAVLMIMQLCARLTYGDHARCDILLTGVLATVLLESSWKRMVNSKSKGQSACVRS